MIKPIVNISKIIDKYNAIILGLRGVITDDKNVNQDVINALVNLKKQGIHIALLSNTAQRVESVIRFLHAHNVPLAAFDAIMTAGEVLHFHLKTHSGDFGALGHNYFRIGDKAYQGVFYGLADYKEVDTLAQADFIYTEGVADKDDTLDKYVPILEHAASLNIPMLCVGNDTSTYSDGDVVLGVAALAEQYAVLGGKILTVGKPDAKLFAYILDGIPQVKKDKVLVIGDNVSTDIKGAQLLGVDSVLISKGVHMHFLGEGYIPDVAKTRELSANFDVNPDYVISGLRW